MTELEEWQVFRAQMKSHQKQLIKLAKSFLELGDYKSSAECSTQAHGLEYALARMPKQKPVTQK